ncbi:hypothetical protein [Aliarcobacter butzleri]|jgi:nickel transport protein|uniref:Cobalt/nickel ECF transporter CbiMNQO, S component CbiN n=3 Tax=Aliarcobacter butzleri TaxID=28197 RepID=A0AAP4PSL0_9BACT|nr:hypothetical protein [Aliarcobacter butzleri]AGR77248.1 putative ABC-type Co/Ni periplasmic permease CbiKLMQO, membrane protein CbiL [Aliarcobacter butzleri 7h1h]KLD95939.1 hypothetical protein AF74_11330 [Aliarcobacter butzleri L349]KLE01225.1 hypothetical protein AA20_03455 [Aliarcobacter butzleri L348]KLE09093.1 hypothetical protein AF80_07625 [Aliarcobacter butzleri L355]MBF7065038.1 hypothetical protein [Aliarcobacter butzleri]
MKKFLLISIIPIFLFAHKINLFLDYENGNLFINSYFANAKGCINCKFEIKDKDGNLIFSDVLNENGEYNYKTNIEELTVVVDAGAGHIVSKEVKETIKDEKVEVNSNDEMNKLQEENRQLKNHIKVLEEQLNYFEIFKVIFGLILIALIFIFLKRVKR